jgi:hypothetical protein
MPRHPPLGYGHISPRTASGQMITIIYAVFGIPIFLILLADFGKLFTRIIKFIWVSADDAAAAVMSGEGEREREIERRNIFSFFIERSALSLFDSFISAYSNKTNLSLPHSGLCETTLLYRIVSQSEKDCTGTSKIDND